MPLLIRRSTWSCLPASSSFFLVQHAQLPGTCQCTIINRSRKLDQRVFGPALHAEHRPIAQRQDLFGNRPAQARVAHHRILNAVADKIRLYTPRLLVSTTGNSGIWLPLRRFSPFIKTKSRPRPGFDNPLKLFNFGFFVYYVLTDNWINFFSSIFWQVRLFFVVV